MVPTYILRSHCDDHLDNFWCVHVLHTRPLTNQELYHWQEKLRVWNKQYKQDVISKFPFWTIKWYVHIMNAIHKKTSDYSPYVMWHSMYNLQLTASPSKAFSSAHSISTRRSMHFGIEVDSTFVSSDCMWLVDDFSQTFNMIGKLECISFWLQYILWREKNNLGFWHVPCCSQWMIRSETCFQISLNSSRAGRWTGANCSYVYCGERY